ncbi:hypothetical protein BEL04_03070 [Mucilaginibacter sp. PPCGB 2223]|nr:hypothetical protein BEL04_03070 [Mucilaginibacter sp. PPCGB 2223]
MNTLKLGSTGPEVVMLQRALAFLNHSNIVADGNFGPNTQAAVVQFQTHNHLTADGVAGPNTWAVLDSQVPQGMDISHHDGQIDWANLSSHIQFVYCKCSQGATYRDPMFAANMAALSQKNIIRGAYHFLTFQDSAQAQIDNFMASGVDFSMPGTLPPALDIEWQVGGSDAQTAALNQYITNNKAACAQIITQWLQGVQAITNRTPVIYTAKGFWNEYFSGVTNFGAYPLWIPAYQPNPPGLPPGWNNYAIWQYSGGSPVIGAPGNVDQDLFNGGITGLKKLALL